MQHLIDVNLKIVRTSAATPSDIMLNLPNSVENRNLIIDNSGLHFNPIVRLDYKKADSSKLRNLRECKYSSGFSRSEVRAMIPVAR